MYKTTNITSLCTRFLSDRIELPGRQGDNGLVGVFDELLSMHIKPLAGLRSASYSALSITLASPSDPYDAVNEGIVHRRAGHHAKARRCDIAPSSPVVPGPVASDAALIDNETGRKTPLLEIRR